MLKREVKRQAMLCTGHLLFNSDWALLFDASGVPEERRATFIEEVQEIGWRLQKQAERRTPMTSPLTPEGRKP